MQVCCTGIPPRYPETRLSTLRVRPPAPLLASQPSGHVLAPAHLSLLALDKEAITLMTVCCMHGLLAHDHTHNLRIGRVLWRCSRCPGTLRAAQAGPPRAPSRPQTLATGTRTSSRAPTACPMAEPTWWAHCLNPTIKGICSSKFEGLIIPSRLVLRCCQCTRPRTQR